MKDNLKNYGLKKIDNIKYVSEREKLKNELEILEEKINICSQQVVYISDFLKNTFNISMELGIDISSDFNKNELTIGDKILFYSYHNGYGIFEGIYAGDEGYASIEDIKVVYHPNGVNWCSYRVDFDNIIKIIEKQQKERNDRYYN